MVCRQTEASFISDESGQATVEFVALLMAGLIMVVALGQLWEVLAEGLFVEHALSSASHHVLLISPGNIADVFLY